MSELEQSELEQSELEQSELEQSELEQAAAVSRREMIQRAGVGGALLAGAVLLARPMAAAADPTLPSTVREAATPTAPAHVTTKGYVDGAVANEAQQRTDAVTSINTTISNLSTTVTNSTPEFVELTSNTIACNFSRDRILTRTASGNITFTGTAYTAGKTVTVRVVTPNSTARTLTFPDGWRWVSFMPTSLAGNRTGILSAMAFGTAADQVVAAWASEG
jgi:hypothetical protein